MKFGIKKIKDDKYEWNLYERSTEKIDDKLYFPLSRPHYIFDTKIPIPSEAEIHSLGTINIPNTSGYFDILSYNLLKKIDDFIIKEEPFRLDKDYFIESFDSPLKLNRRKINKSKLNIDKLTLLRKTTILEEDKEKEVPVYVFYKDYTENNNYVIFLEIN